MGTDPVVLPNYAFCHMSKGLQKCRPFGMRPPELQQFAYYAALEMFGCCGVMGTMGTDPD